MADMMQLTGRSDIHHKTDYLPYLVNRRSATPHLKFNQEHYTESVNLWSSAYPAEPWHVYELNESNASTKAVNRASYNLLGAMERQRLILI